MLQLESTHSFLSACEIEWKSWIKLADITLMIYSKTLNLMASRENVVNAENQSRYR